MKTTDTETTVTVGDLLRENRGLYKVVAKNEMGEAWASVSLMVCQFTYRIQCFSVLRKYCEMSLVANDTFLPFLLHQPLLLPCIYVTGRSDSVILFFRRPL